MAQELQRLLSEGVVGCYRSFELTEIVGFKRGEPPTNFLTLAVAEPTDAPAAEIPEPRFLNEERLVLAGTEWKIGVVRYRISLETLVNAVDYFSETGLWKPGREHVRVGALAPVAPQFVPANSYQEVPWNRVLKNNFWEGSHVLELFDTSKPYVKFLLKDSRFLTELSRLVRPFVPIGIDALSDRLGNILIQLPVTVISTGVRGSREGRYEIAIEWDPCVAPRALRIFSEIYEDFTVEGFDSAPITTGAASLRMYSPSGGARTHIWDDQNRVLLSATPVNVFITSISFSTRPVEFGGQLAPRKFLLPEANGQLSPESVVLNHTEGRTHTIGSTSRRPRQPWQKNRIFNETLAAIEERKEVVQYGRIADAGREEAFHDIRWLIQQHGRQGVWLWDPFLSADDVLRTLFFCPHGEADLRALTSGSQPHDYDGGGEMKSSKSQSSRRTRWLWGNLFGRLCRKSLSTTLAAHSWEEHQACRLESAKGNCHGLRLEFRVRKGGAGWPFHDRFIIFPREDEAAIAWSLGTSVNSLGRQHHILQKVSNGELIANAFRDLWDKLGADEYLIWKTP